MKRLADKILPNAHRQVIFEHEWRKDFVGEALTVEIDATGTMVTIEFYSARHGVVKWTARVGLGIPRRWEADSAAAVDSNAVAKHFPASLLDGATHDINTLTIVDAVLDNFSASPLADAIRQSLAHPQVPTTVDENCLTAFPVDNLRPSVPVDPPGTSRNIVRVLAQAVLDFMRPYTAWSANRSFSPPTEKDERAEE